MLSLAILIVLTESLDTVHKQQRCRVTSVISALLMGGSAFAAPEAAEGVRGAGLLRCACSAKR